MEEQAGNPPPGGEAVGMPQLDVSSYPNQIFWLIVALVAIYFILTRTALPRIAAVLAERRGTVTNDLAAAEDMKAKAQEAEDAYNKALADARAEAGRIMAETRAEMQKDIDAAQERAEADIAAKSAESERRIAEIRDSAVADVRTVARDTAREIVAAFGYSAEAGRVETAVDARVTERGQ